MKRILSVCIMVIGLLYPTTAYGHHDGQDCDWDGCYSQDYDQWNNEDKNRNRNRNRGAFSPGPFDDSPVDAFNNVCMPGATCHYDGDRRGEPQPGDGQQPSR